MNSRPKNPKYARNKNIVVIGDSGSGKTRFFVKPSLMQMHSSYVVTDPKGELLLSCGKLLQRGGYKIKVLNTINFKKSMRYNPFAYIRSEKDILKLVNTIIMNTKGDGEKSGEDFWTKSERLFYSALIGYIFYEAPEEEKNFTTLLEMINASEAREDDPEFQSPVDLMFQRLEEKDPEHFAVRQYKKYKLAAVATGCIAVFTPMLVTNIEKEMGQDSAFYARYRGISESKILLRYALPSAVVAILPNFCQMLGLCMAGSAIVERVFSLPGLGYLIIDSVLYRDSMVIHATILFLAFSLVIFNILSDILRRFLLRDIKTAKGIL